LSDWKVRIVIKTRVVLIHLLMALLGQHIKIVITFWFCLMSVKICSNHWVCERTKLIG
jgi:hypothetical protein